MADVICLMLGFKRRTRTRLQTLLPRTCPCTARRSGGQGSIPVLAFHFLFFEKRRAASVLARVLLPRRRLPHPPAAAALAARHRGQHLQPHRPPPWARANCRGPGRTPPTPSGRVAPARPARGWGVRWTWPLLPCAASRWRFGGFVLIQRLSLLFPMEILGLRRRWHLRNPGRRRPVSLWPAACSAATSGRTALPLEVNSLLLSRKSWGLEELGICHVSLLGV